MGASVHVSRRLLMHVMSVHEVSHIVAHTSHATAVASSKKTNSHVALLLVEMALIENHAVALIFM